MKLHLGCGSVYLRDWLNVDVRGPHTFLAEKRPDLVEKWSTTEDRYYAKHADKNIATMRRGPLHQEYVCDMYGDFSNINLAYDSCEEVLARQTFEHLGLTEARHGLDTVEAIMPIGGILRIDVPDHEATLKLFRETGDEFYIRHLLGPRRDEFGFHMMSYTREHLRNLVEQHGFRYIGEEENIHCYPAFCLRFEKRGLDGSYTNVKPPYEIPANWRVIDIGPGGFPFKRANVYLDHNAKTLEAIALQDGQQIIVGDLMSGLPEIPNKAFDYAWCSHVLEHVHDVTKVARTLSRIAKRGTVVLPSVVKESLFHFEETDHKWLVVPHPEIYTMPIFIRHHTSFIESLRDTELQKITCQLYRTGPTRHGDDQRYMRNWFHRNESKLDVVVHWENNFNPLVIS